MVTDSLQKPLWRTCSPADFKTHVCDYFASLNRICTCRYTHTSYIYDTTRSPMGGHIEAHENDATPVVVESFVPVPETQKRRANREADDESLPLATPQREKKKSKKSSGDSSKKRRHDRV